jgi:hypothetical protein
LLLNLSISLFVDIVLDMPSIIALLSVSKISIINLCFPTHWFRLGRVPILCVFVPSFKLLVHSGSDHTGLLPFDTLSKLDVQIVLSRHSSVSARSTLALQHAFVVPIA